MKKILFITLILILTAGVNASWVPLTPGAANGETPLIHSLLTKPDETIFSMTIPGVMVQEINSDSASFQKLEIPQAGWLKSVGNPELPAIRKNFIVPLDAIVSLEITANQTVTLSDYNIWPAQASYKRNEPKPAFQLNQRLYNQNTQYPASWGKISQDAILRDFRFVTVEINPIHTIPSTGELIAATDLTVRIITSGSSGIEPVSVFPAFDQLYRRVLANYGELNTRQRTDAEPMLIICYDNFISDMDAFVEWKTKRGIDVTLVSSTETGTSNNDIQTYIQTVWSTWNPKPVYIVLVGDAPQLNPLYGIGSCASDSKFTLLEGSDTVPDTFISRFSAGTSGELSTQLAKVLTYEQNPPTGAWMNKFAGLASNQGSGPSDEERSQEIESRFTVQNPDSTADRIYEALGHGATEISSAVNDGRFWVSYFGHGSGTSWSGPSFSNSNVDALTNGFMTPFVMDVSCDNGSFAGGSDCFAERWLKGDDGAVSMFSSSTSTSWDEPAEMAWGVCYSVCGNTPGTITGGNFVFGQMTLDGITHMYDIHGVNSATEEVMNQYVLFGDCSALFRSDSHITPSVSHSPSAPMAPSNFQVTVTNGSALEGAMVCAYKPGEVHEVALTDAAGIAQLNINPQTVGDMIITVYGQNLIPQESIVMVAPAGCGSISLDRTGYNCDDTINISVIDSHLNTNPGSIDTVLVDISSESEPTSEDVLLSETGPDTAQFTGTILTSDSQSGPGYLMVGSGDTITAHYHDEDCEGSEADVYDTAGVDCTGPVLTNVTVSAVGTSSAIISWTSSEACDSLLVYGTTTPPTTELYNGDATTSHSVTVDGLTDCTTYRFMVQGTDSFGNVGTDNNGGAYYSFTTWELQIFFEDDMESGENGWTSTGLWHIVPEGSSCNEAHGGVNSWYYGQESSCDFDTGSQTSGTLTSPVIDLTGILDAEMYLWYWFEGEVGSEWDVLTISVRIVGGATTELHVQSDTTSGWEELVVDLSEVAGNQIQILCEFDSIDNYMNTYRGAYIDDISVIAAQPCEATCVNNGDVNLDGEVTAGDAQLAFQCALGSMTPTPEEACAADCNGDDTITAGDAQQIFQTALGHDTCADPV